MNVRLVIDNQHIEATGGRMFDRNNPITEKSVTQAPAGSVEDAVRAADSAHAAFASWRKTGPTERRRILLLAADKLEGKLEAIQQSMAEEVGAPGIWSHGNVMAAVALVREAAMMTTQIQGETIPTDKPGTLSMTLREPMGAILSIVPWNGAIVLAARAIAYPLACGNTVIFRASETSPRTHYLVAQAFYEAGLPPGVLNFVLNAPADAPAVVEALIAHPAVRSVNFTGSSHVGRIIAEKAGKYLKRSLLELGGKAPFVVLDDADVDAAVEAAVFGAFMFQGQICMSTERFVVDEKVADTFAKKFAERASSLAVGDPTSDRSVIVGPMIGSASGKRINAMIEDAVAKGAKVIAGSQAEGAVMKPTIVDHVKPGMTIYYEETFGPITTIVRVNGVEEAVRVANDTEYGLAAAVFGHDTVRALQVARMIDAGHVHVNGSTVQNEAQAPYGGMKASGWGRFDGRAVINEFTEEKWVTLEPARQSYPF